MRPGYINCMTMLAIHGNFVHQKIAETSRLCELYTAHKKLYKEFHTDQILKVFY